MKDTGKTHLYTIGHSNLDLETFIQLLKDHEIEVLVDVRSTPYSRFASQFNKHNIEKAIRINGMKYLYLGKELGGRPKDQEFYDSERHVLYSKIAGSSLFAEGIERLIKGIKIYRVAIMCGEENPAYCHRQRLVGRALIDKGIQLLHIRRDGTVQSEADIMRESMKNEAQQKLFKSAMLDGL